VLTIIILPLLGISIIKNSRTSVICISLALPTGLYVLLDNVQNMSGELGGGCTNLLGFLGTWVTVGQHLKQIQPH